jgi:hypothetical protein
MAANITTRAASTAQKIEENKQYSSDMSFGALVYSQTTRRLLKGNWIKIKVIFQFAP